MKKTFKKLLVCILIVLILNNSIIGNISHASGIFGNDDPVGIIISTALGGIVGVFLSLFSIPAGILANIVEALLAWVAYSQGSIDADGNIIPDGFFSGATISPFDIIFNKIAILDVNFFNIPDDNTMIGSIRKSVAGWYYLMRNFASAILLCILIYVGIRMAISTVASDKAAYKKMLVDWICSLALIFLIQYIIIFTLNVNQVFVKSLATVGSDVDRVKFAMAYLKIVSVLPHISMRGIATTVVYCMIVSQTLSLFVTYFNRMLKIAFLIIISPLITLTYSIDKMGDGKAQALGTWLKEFVYTVLIQTFHCIIYMAFISIAFELLAPDLSFEIITESSNLAGCILAMLCITFTKDAEKILGKIFKFSDSTSDTSLAAGMVAASALWAKSKSIGKGTKKMVVGAKNLHATFGDKLMTARVEARAIRNIMKKDPSEKIDYETEKQQAEEEILAKKTEKLDKKNAREGHKYANKSEKDEALKKKIEELQGRNENVGISDSLLAARARHELAKEQRKTIKDEKKSKKQQERAKKHPKISGFTGKVKSKYDQSRKVLDIINKSETGEVIKDILSTAGAGGIAAFAGAATYGASGNLLNAFTLGMGTYNGSKEIFTGTLKSIENRTTSLAEGAGIQSKEELEKRLEKVLAMSGIYGDNEELQKHLDKLMKSVDTALKGMDPYDIEDYKSEIKRIIAKNLKEHPDMSSEDIINKVLQEESIAEHADKFTDAGIDLTGIVKATEVALRDKEFYDSIQSASDIGREPKVFIKEVAKRYIPVEGESVDDSSRFKLNSQIIEELETPDEHGDRTPFKYDDSSDTYANPDEGKLSELEKMKGESAYQELIRQIEEEKNVISRELELNTKMSDAEKDDLKALERVLAESLQAMYNRELDKQAIIYEQKIRELETKYQEQIDHASSVLHAQVLERSRDAEIAEIRKEADEYLEYMMYQVDNTAETPYLQQTNEFIMHDDGSPIKFISDNARSRYVSKTGIDIEKLKLKKDTKTNYSGKKFNRTKRSE